MSKPPSPRMRKVNELLREVIAEEVAGLKDPRIGFLKSAARRFQAAIGRQTRLKYTPVLEFRVDPSIDQGLRIEALLQQIHDEEGDDE